MVAAGAASDRTLFVFELAGLKLPVTPAGRPDTLNATDPLNPFAGNTATPSEPPVPLPAASVSVGSVDKLNVGAGITKVNVVDADAVPDVPVTLTVYFPGTAVLETKATKVEVVPVVRKVELTPAGTAPVVPVAGVENVTGEANPVLVTPSVPPCPIAKVSVEEESETLAGTTAVPVSATVCVAPAALPALSVTVRVALRLPAAPGVKVTKIVQFEPAATLPAQVLVWAKSPAFVPLMVMLEIVSAPVPALLSFTVCAPLVVLTFWLANERAVGDSAADGTPVPVPLSNTVCVDPATFPELSVIVNVLLCAPAALGVNVTEIVQVALAASEVPQLLVATNSVPLAAILAIDSAALPVLLKVTALDALAVPMFWLPKARLPADRPAVGTPTPVPLSVTVCVEPATAPELSVIVNVLLRAPLALGVNVTEIVQVPLTASEVPQLLVATNSVPLAAILAIVSAAEPVLLKVTVLVPLVVPTF